MPADARRVADAMSDRDWQSLTVQLGRYAWHKSRRFYWNTGRSGELPAGEVIESIVSKAFVLWLSGQRRWNTAEYPDLLAFLKGVIDSLLSHAARGFDNRRGDSDEAMHHVWPSTPESELLERERATAAEATLAEIVRRSQDDEVALAILAAMREGAATRRDLIAVTGHSADVIDNGLKRLRRLGASVARSTNHDSAADRQRARFTAHR